MKVPEHLKRYVVEQDYSRYTAEDQAVWRYIMRQLKDFLSKNAHPCYLEGLKRTGIEIEQIPKIEEMNKKLNAFGWGAVPVSGFIPPAAFMEFQSLGILPIASDMRTLDHLLYTPAPDIVHEAAGHAPILVNEEFASYLRKYAEVASHAIISKEDMQQYDAIRELSDVKENPESTPTDVQIAEQNLQKVNDSISHISEAAWLSRMNWWTAEYGLIGSLEEPKIFGAGLLSSVGESKECLSSKVKKFPLSLHCVDVSYDITEPQPQLFVTPDFSTLHDVLEQLAERLAYRRGGIYGVKRALQAQTVNTVELNSRLQISGVLTEYEESQGEITFLKFSGPCQISVNKVELAGHGKTYHSQGFSSPIGFLENFERCPSELTDSDLVRIGCKKGQQARMKFRSGIEVKGLINDLLFEAGKLLLITWSDCRVSKGDKTLFDPSWGTFDMAVGSKVTSVFGGPADRMAYGETEDFVARRVPARRLTDEQRLRLQYFAEIRTLREQVKRSNTLDQVFLQKMVDTYFSRYSKDWILALELLEMVSPFQSYPEIESRLKTHLLSNAFQSPQAKICVDDGLRLAAQTL